MEIKTKPDQDAAFASVFIFKYSIFIWLVIAVFFSACGNSDSQAPQADLWNYSKEEITGIADKGAEKIEVDVYLDVTTSMKGYASANNTNFSHLIDDIEAVCQNTWKETDLKFFKYGRSVVPISRAEFVTGKNSPVIYSDPQLSTQTNFAGALQTTDASRVSILITDFFYNNSDVNLVVNAIKDSCIKKNPEVEIGIIGLTSSFNGIVGDVSPAVKVNGDRPVYVLIFADKKNISRLFASLKAKPYVNNEQLLLFTDHPVESYEVILVKNKKNRTVNNNQGKIGRLKEHGTVFGFSTEKKELEAELDLTLKTTLSGFTPAIAPGNIKVTAFKKNVKTGDSTVASNDIQITEMAQNGNEITGMIKLTNNDPKGNYSYAIYLSLDNTVPQKMPAWVNEVNTDTYAQGVNENKTLNLEKMLASVSTVFNTTRQPQIAKFFIQLEKK